MLTKMTLIPQTLFRFQSRLAFYKWLHQSKFISISKIPNCFYSTESDKKSKIVEKTPLAIRSMFRNDEGKRTLFPAFSAPVETFLAQKVELDKDISRLVAKSASFAVYSFLGIAILGTVGIDTKPFITGLGITGFTIGFALKDIATNFLAGLMLMTQKPFKSGDRVKVAGLEGTVDSVDVRYVILKSESGQVVMIPSSIVYSSSVIVEKKPRLTINKSV